MFPIHVVNRHKVDIKTLPGHVIDIMQSHGAVLGNPYYKLPRWEGIRLFGEWLWIEYQKNGAVKQELLILREWLAEGATIYLVCVCNPLPCHGDVIKRCLEWMLSSEWTSQYW